MRPRVWIVGGLEFVVLITIWTVAAWWTSHLSLPRNFGLDMGAYVEAAARIRTTGTPYSAELMAGPIANTIDNVPVGYLYPPPLAQLFLFAPSGAWVTVAWCLAQGVGLAIVLIALGRCAAVRGSLQWISWAVLWVAFLPLSVATYIGNISGWIAVGVGLMFLVAPNAASAIGATVAIAKGITVPVGIAVLASSSHARRVGVLSAALACGISLIALPRAWLDWIRILPNLSEMAPGTAPSNLAFGAVLEPFGLTALGTLVRLGCLIMALIFLAFAVARRHQRAAIALGVAASLVLPATLWDHHVAVLAVVIAAAWRDATRHEKVALAGCIAVQGVLWTSVTSGPPLVVLVDIALCAAAVIAIRIHWRADSVAGHGRQETGAKPNPAQDHVIRAVGLAPGRLSNEKLSQLPAARSRAGAPPECRGQPTAGQSTRSASLSRSQPRAGAWLG